MTELKLPELGENVESADVAAVLVKVGDRIEADQPVIEVETEKASLEVPATSPGVVKELLVGVGDKIEVGQVILRLDAAVGEASEKAREPEGAGPRGEAAEREPEATEREAGAARARRDEAEGREGKNAAEAQPEGGRKKRKATGAEPGGRRKKKRKAAEREAEPARRERAEEGAAGGPQAVIEFPTRRKPEIGPTVPAAPSVRALARELGVEILEVRGTGPGGRISREDVKSHAKAIIRGAAASAGAAAPGPATRLPDFTQWGQVTTEPLSNVRRAIARNMATAWSTVPHVTQFDRADITQLESMRKRFNARDEGRGGKLTVTAVVIKMVAHALRQYPRFNASLDLANEVVVHKRYVHIGVAVDTERGLLVPVVRDVDRKSLVQVAEELDALSGKAREGKLGLEEMSGASFTVSNLGGLGTTYFAPIVNWPQAAILGVGRAAQQAVWEEGQFQPRLILPLSVSYDHRLIDGADAARFLRWLAEALEQPLLLLLDE